MESFWAEKDLQFALFVMILWGVSVFAEKFDKKNILETIFKLFILGVMIFAILIFAGSFLGII